MITFDHVTKRYATNVGLNDVSVKINKGDFVFLVGPSGAGKSTFIKLILKELEADEGTITVKGYDVTNMSNRKIPDHRRNIGIVFQDFRLLPNKTVYENIAFAMEITHQSKRAIRKSVPQTLSLMGIKSYANKYPDELSAGEQQRVAIARAIVNKPTVLIADEPTGNLDPKTAWEIMELLDEINQRGTTIVMVTHAKDIVDKMKKRVIVIEKGNIVRDEFGEYGKFGNTIKEAQAIDAELEKEEAERKAREKAERMAAAEEIAKAEAEAEKEKMQRRESGILKRITSKLKPVSDDEVKADAEAKAENKPEEKQETVDEAMSRRRSRRGKSRGRVAAYEKANEEEIFRRDGVNDAGIKDMEKNAGWEFPPSMEGKTGTALGRETRQFQLEGKNDNFEDKIEEEFSRVEGLVKDDDK